jgi:hypothetical protein
MKLNLGSHKGPTEAEIRYGSVSDLGFVREWDRALGSDKNPVRADACLFAQLAVKRFQTHGRIENYATSIQEISDFTRDNPQVEVANLVLLECDSTQLSRIIGVCHFRRTWCNNVVIDYLSVHPWIARPKDETGPRGVGTALLYFVAQVARFVDATLLWGEATQHSCRFYDKAFRLNETKDLIHAERSQVDAFVQHAQKKYGFPDL